MSTAPVSQLTIEHIQQLVEELRAAYEDLVSGETVAAPAQIRAIVAEWSTTILPAIDGRIARCHELIKRGLRTEAIDHALEIPNLFDAVKLLDLERFGAKNNKAWMDASRAAGLMLPAPPQLEKFADIKAAHDQLAELRPLLERWRQMNIQRVPLANRIRMLRELESRDTGSQSDVWHALLRDHEAHRIMEIKATLARIRDELARDRTADVATLEQDVVHILSELQDDWSVIQPPPEVSDQARTLVAGVQQRRADTAIDALVPELVATHAQLTHDRPAAKEKLLKLLDEWNRSLADRGVVDPADARIARVHSIIGYAEGLREIDRLTREVSQLVNERPATLQARLVWAEDLDRMMDHVDAAASQLPSEDIDSKRIRELSRRVGDVAEAVQFEARMRRYVSVATVAAAIAGLSATGWAVYAFRQHHAAVQAAVTAADELVKQIQAGDDRGSELEDSMGVAVRRDPSVAAALERVTQARQSRLDRGEAFAKHLSDIAAALAELKKEKRPEALTPWPDTFARATALLATARDTLALGDDERAKLEQPAATLRTVAKQLGEDADDAFEDQVKRLEADVTAIGTTLADDPDRADQQIDQAEAMLAKLRTVAATNACPTAEEGYQGRKIVSQPVAALVAADSKVATALNDIRTRRETIAGIAGRENQADRLLADAKYPEYADLIRKIADDLGSGPIARDYGAVARDHQLWRAVTDWQRFVASLGSPASLDAAQAGAALERVRAIDAESLRFHDAKETKQWLEPALGQLADCTPEKFEELKAKFSAKLDGQHGEMLDGVIWEKSQQAQPSNYPRYYCLLKDRPLPTQEKSIKYVNGRPDKSRLWPTTSLQFNPESFEVADSPQKTLAAACREAAESARRTGFAIDRLGAVVVAEAASRQNTPAGGLAIDPCLQAILVRFLVTDACAASPRLKKWFSKTLKAIDAGKTPDGDSVMLAGVDNEVFSAVLDPKKQDNGAWVQTNRAKCDAFVQLAANEATEAIRALEAQAQAFGEKFAGLKQYRCIGRLRRLSSGGWTISGGTAATRARKRLFIAGGPQDDYEMIPCVTCDKDGGIPAGSEIKVRAGDPVFELIASGKAG